MKAQGFTLIELLIVIAIIAILALIAIPNFLESQNRAKVARAQSDMRTLATALEAYGSDYRAMPVAYYGSPSAYRKAADPAGAYYIYKGAYFIRHLQKLTTPVAYTTTIPPDVFQEKDPTRMRVGIPTDPMFDQADYIDQLEGRQMLSYVYEVSVDAMTAAGRASTQISANKMLHMENWVAANGSSPWMLLSAGPDCDVFSGYRSEFDDPIFNGKYLSPTLPAGVPAPNLEARMLVPWPLGCYDPTNGTISWGSVRRTASARNSN